MDMYLEVLDFFATWAGELNVDQETSLTARSQFEQSVKLAPFKEELRRVLTSNNVSKYFDYRYMN